jgi:hypothetical protein
VCVTPIDNQRVCVGAKRMFSVDAVHNVTDSTEVLFNAHVRPLVDMFVEGYNATVLAYGQTGTGKTFTMSGVSPLVMQHLHHRLGGVEQLSFQHVEVYGDVIRDLFAQDGDVTKPLQMFDGVGAKGAHVIGACRVRVRNLADAALLFDHGAKMRTTGATNMNNASSRSHSILTIFNPTKMSKLHLVDLAGSERNKKTGNIGVRFKESIGINCGLLALGNVIRALSHPQQQQQQHIPYRASKLTRLLQDSLGGNSKTLFVACIAPDTANLDETVRTLQYSSKAMQILNEPVPNMDVLVAQQQRQLRRLQNAHNLSSEEALRQNHAAADAFASEQAAEIQRLTALVSDLEREVRLQKLELKKDEVVFAKQLKEHRATLQENKRLRNELERAFAAAAAGQHQPTKQVYQEPLAIYGEPELSTVRWCKEQQEHSLDASLVEDCRKLEAQLKHTEGRWGRKPLTTPATTRGTDAGGSSRGGTQAQPVRGGTPHPRDPFESFIAETANLALKLAGGDEVLSPLQDDVRSQQGVVTPPRVHTKVRLFCDDTPPPLESSPHLSSIQATPSGGVAVNSRPSDCERKVKGPHQTAEKDISLQEVLKDSLYYYNSNMKLRDQLQATLHDNDALVRDNSLLREELRQIQEILELS